MSEYRDIIVSMLKRAIFASPFLAVGVFVLFRTLESGSSPQEGYAMSLFGCAGILIGAVILAFPLARLIAEPSGNLFWPGHRFKRPQPMYSIPQSKRAQGLYEEAIAGFEKIAAEYTEEVKPHIEMIDIAIVNLKDPDRANAIYQRGVSVLKRDEDKEILASMYGNIRTRLNSKLSN